MRNKHRYSNDWYDIIRPEALKRASYKCQQCNAKHKSIGYRSHNGVWIECDMYMLQWCKVQGIKVHKLFLQISHTDHDTSNNKPENLRALCPRCHLSFDKTIRHIKRLSS